MAVTKQYSYLPQGGDRKRAGLFILLKGEDKEVALELGHKPFDFLANSKRVTVIGPFGMSQKEKVQKLAQQITDKAEKLRGDRTRKQAK